MIRKLALGTGIVLLSASAAFADFSYKETATITGGMMASMMKVAGVFSKSAKEPTESTIAIKGNRMMHRSKDSASIIDLDAETISSVDFQKKTYSVMTFAEMKKALDDAMRSMDKKNGADFTFKVSVDNTGKTRDVAGQQATESILKMDMEGKDAKTGQTVPAMRITTDMWMVKGVAGYDEARDFQTRMAKKLNWTPGGNMFMSRPDMAKGMAGLAEEMSKINGVPVLQYVSMGAAVEGQQGQAPQQQPQAEKPSVGGVLGSRLGGLGGLMRKKENKTDAPAETKPAANDAPPSTPGALIEMKMEMSGFSSASVDGLQFEVPAGFKKVDSGLKK